jgi:flavodoxin I
MKALIIYDSFFGNTEKIAQAIGDAIAGIMDVEICKVSDIEPVQLKELSLLIVGSPIRAFRPSPTITKFLKSIPVGSLNGVKAAAFDTRIGIENIKSRTLRFFVNFFGYAAKPISEKLRKKGAEIVIAPEGFFVNDTKGPLQDGELERAAAWSKQIISKLQST